MTDRAAGRPWAGSTRRSRLPSDWQRRRAIVLERDPTCRLRTHCDGTRSTEVDHVQRGDDHRLENLQGACTPCHRAKTQREAQAARFKTDRSPEPHPGVRGDLPRG